MTWSAAYLEHRAALQAYACALTGCPEQAADLLQDALLRLVAAARPADSPRAYLMRTLRNLAIDRYRSRRPDASPLADDVLAPLAPDAVAAEEQRDALRTALEALRPDVREVIVLKTHCEMTLAEIAEVTALPAGTVASHYRRGLEQLRTLLCEEEDDDQQAA